jgi:hypothetical protein
MGEAPRFGEDFRKEVVDQLTMLQALVKSENVSVD